LDTVSSARFFPVALAAAIFGFGLYFDHALSSDTAPQLRATEGDTELAREAASPEVRRLAYWAVTTQDHAGLPFVVIDPAQARIFAFDPQGHPTGHASIELTHDDALAAAGRLVADPMASARSGTLVWANADTQVAVGTGDEDAQEPIEPALKVDAAFWRACLAHLRTQPSVAYVLPRGTAEMHADAQRRPL
jgi:hypothetical protein